LQKEEMSSRTSEERKREEGEGGKKGKEQGQPAGCRKEEGQEIQRAFLI
jgi:hypothetical protein